MKNLFSVTLRKDRARWPMWLERASLTIAIPAFLLCMAFVIMGLSIIAIILAPFVEIEEE